CFRCLGWSARHSTLAVSSAANDGLPRWAVREQAGGHDRRGANQVRRRQVHRRDGLQAAGRSRCLSPSRLPPVEGGRASEVTQNIYDDAGFFAGYSRLRRSVDGLDGAPEWPTLRAMLPDVAGKRVVDLGCGFGWFCRFAREAGAAQVLGLDVSA